MSGSVVFGQATSADRLSGRRFICARAAALLVLLFASTLLEAQGSAPRINSIARGNGKVVIRWQGGSAPYQLQMRTSLSAPWQDVGAAVSGLEVTNTMSSQVAFYRVKCGSNPAPGPVQLAGFLPALGTPRDAQVVGNVAYVASEEFGLATVDVSDPRSPRVLGASNKPFYGNSLTVSGNRAYVTGSRTFYESNGVMRSVAVFHVMDVSNPAAPTVLGTIESASSTFGGVAAAGNYVYLAAGSAGLRVVNVSNPAQPVFAGTGFDTPGNAGGVQVAGNFAYVADGSRGLRILNVSNPLAPTEAGFYDTPGNAKGVAVAGTVAYVADVNALRVVNVLNPAAPVLAGSLSMGAMAVTVQNNVCYVATSAGGMKVVDVATAAAPVQLAELPPSGAFGAVTLGVCVSGSFAYLANGAGGLAIANVSIPALPAPYGNQMEWFEAFKMGARPGLAVLSGAQHLSDGTLVSGLRIIDTSDPAKPRMVGKIDDAAMGLGGVEISGNYAFVAAGLAGVKVVDISSPGAPRVVGSGYDTPGNAQGIRIAGNFAYVADGSQGLRILNISNPLAPTSAGWVDTPGNAFEVAVAGNMAYVADVNSLQLIDVNNAANPSIRGSFPVSAMGVAVQNNIAFVAASRSGLVAVNVSNPGSPVQLGSIAPTGGASGSTMAVSVSGSMAYLANGNGGFARVNISNPAAPLLTDAVLPLGVCQSVVFDGSWACLTDTLGGILTIRLDQ